MNQSRVKGGRPTPGPHFYWWRNMPVGTTRPAASPIDAMIEVLMLELKYPRVLDLLADLEIPASSISRTRHRIDPVRHSWLMRAAIISGIPYRMLCEVTGEPEQIFPHHNAWGQK